MTGILVIPMSVHVTLLQQRLNGLHSASWQYKNMHECAHPLPPHTHTLACSHTRTHGSDETVVGHWKHWKKNVQLFPLTDLLFSGFLCHFWLIRI